MKYQGFYDSVYSVAGVPDRTFSAKQFCAHLKGLIGNGIGLTKATGDNVWKVVKTGDLKVKITLGNTDYNFASLDGNPFAIDEELNFELSEGTNRWDSIIIRADATSEIRMTDVKLQEGSIEILRNTDIYDLRLARIHVVNNVITEIIDDRLDNEFCGIANGLTTVPTEELIQLINDISSGEQVALKDGNLQEGLNAEMLGGKTVDEILNSAENNKPYVVGSYTGDDVDGRVISLDFTPQAVIVKCQNLTYLEGALAVTNSSQKEGGSSNDTILSITTNGFTINTSSVSVYNANKSGQIYNYIAFK